MLPNRKIIVLSFLWSFVAVMVSACSFTPLYGDKQGNEHIETIMRSIGMKANETPFDFELVQQLRWELYQGGSAPKEPRYSLQHSVKKTTVQTAIERVTGDPRSYTLTLTIDFELVDLEAVQQSKVDSINNVKAQSTDDAQSDKSENKAEAKPDNVVFRNKQTARASFDSTEQRYRRALAEEQAEITAIKEITHRFSRDLAIFITQGHLAD